MACSVPNSTRSWLARAASFPQRRATRRILSSRGASSAALTIGDFLRNRSFQPSEGLHSAVYQHRLKLSLFGIFRFSLHHFRCVRIFQNVTVCSIFLDETEEQLPAS